MKVFAVYTDTCRILVKGLSKALGNIHQVVKPCSGSGCIGPRKSISTSIVRCMYRRLCREASVLTSDSFVNDEKASLKHISLMYLAKAYEKIQGRVKNLSGWRSWPSDVNRSCFSIPSQCWWGDSIHITCFCHFPPLKSENILKIVFSSGNVAEQKWVVKIYVECY